MMTETYGPLEVVRPLESYIAEGGTVDSDVFAALLGYGRFIIDQIGKHSPDLRHKDTLMRYRRLCEAATKSTGDDYFNYTYHGTGDDSRNSQSGEDVFHVPGLRHARNTYHPRRRRSRR